MKHQVKHFYVLVRTDIPLANQMVQATHAAYEASKRFSPCQEVIDYAVICRVDSLESLLKAKHYLDSHFVQNYLFIEPDIDNEATALCTEPLYNNKRKILSNYKLWSY